MNQHKISPELETALEKLYVTLKEGAPLTG